MTVAAYEDFKVEQFWTDVEKYMIRNGISKVEMAYRYITVDPSWFKKAMRERLSPSLRIACLLAKQCDLSLDSYVR